MMVVVIEMAHAVRVGFGKCRREHGTGDCGGGEDLRDAFHGRLPIESAGRSGCYPV
jgi:hypothetical protein